ncbi:MAG: hypothetical protein ACI9RI_001303, partial [Oceanospirillaceae bacterium]
QLCNNDEATGFVFKKAKPELFTQYKHSTCLLAEVSIRQ